MNAVGIASSYVYIYGGEYNLDCSDDINYISYAIQTDELFIAKGHLTLFGSGGAFTRNPSYYTTGDGYPYFSRYSTVSGIKTGSSASSCSSGQKADLQEYHKYVTFNVSAHCDTIELSSLSSPIIGEKVADSLDVFPLSTRQELRIKSAAWCDASGTVLSSATKFVSGKKYQLVIYLTSPVTGMIDSSTKCPTFLGITKPTATGKIINQDGEQVYVLTITMNSVESISPKVWINGERFTTNGPGNQIVYDRNRGVLTLNNAEIEKYSTITDDLFRGNAAVYSEEDLTVVLEGNSYIHIGQVPNTSAVYGIASNGSITFTGNGSLTILMNDENSFGIFASDNITFDSGCTVKITVKADGIDTSYGDIINNGTLNVYGKGTGIFAETGDLINKGNLYVSSDDTPIYLFHGDLQKSSNQKVLGSVKVNDTMENLTEATFGTAKSVVKSSGKEAMTIFIGVPGHIHIYNQKVESPEFLKEFVSCKEYNTYYYSCSCGEKDPSGRTFVSSTKKGNHTAEYVQKVDATCQKDGHIAYYKCTTCGKLFSDSACTKEITDINSTVIKKIDHIAGDWITDKAATTESEGHRHKECTMCGKVLQEEAIPKLKSECKHSHTAIQNAKTATCQSEGYTGDKVCTDCGKVLETGKSVPKTNHDYDEDGICRVCGTQDPSRKPTEAPAVTPTASPEVTPTSAPDVTPTGTPDITPTEAPDVTPTEAPEATLTPAPSEAPSATPEPSATTAPTNTPAPTATTVPTVTPGEKDKGSTDAKGMVPWWVLIVVLLAGFAGGYAVCTVINRKRSEKDFH